MNKNLSTISWLIKQVKEYIPSLVLLTVISICSAWFGVKYALIARDLIDSAVAGSDAAFKYALLSLCIFIVIALTLKLLRRHLSEKLSFDLDRYWKKDILHTLLTDDYLRVSSFHSGNLLSRMNADVRVVDSGLISLFPGVLGTVAKLIFAVIVMGQLEPKLTAFVCIGGVAVVIASAFLRNILKDMHKKAMEAGARVSSFIQEVIERILVVQALDAGDEIEKRAENLLEDRYRLQVKRKNIGLVTGGGLSVICILAEMGILVWCVFRLRAGEMSFGTLAAMVTLFAKVESPFLNMSGIIPRYVAMLGSTERIREILPETCMCVEDGSAGTFPENSECPQDISTGMGLMPSFSMTSLYGRNICFRYEDASDPEYVLSNICFDIPKNSFCAVTGQSGIGKSTLLKLLLGIYKPESGELKVITDDDEITIDRTTRSLFAYVPQGNMLFSGTLRENLLLTRPDATDEELTNAICIADMEAFISELPEELDTRIGENALGISEGQAQRVSIARAVLSGKPVILLDEATSALDAETERRVLSNIKAIPGITTIAVTHRPAAVEMSDTVIELH